MNNMYVLSWKLFSNPTKNLLVFISSSIYIHGNKKIEHFNFGFFDLCSINVSVTTLTAQRTRIDILSLLQFPPSLAALFRREFSLQIYDRAHCSLLMYSSQIKSSSLITISQG